MKNPAKTFQVFIAAKVAKGFSLVLWCFFIGSGVTNDLFAAERLRGGDFESRRAMDHWEINNWAKQGSVTLTRDHRDAIRGGYSARIDIEGEPDGAAETEWHELNLRQVFDVSANRTYFGTYRVRASQPATMVVQLLEDGDPHRGIAFTEVQIGEGEQFFRVVGATDFSGMAQIMFNFGKTRRGTSVWLDDVSVTERLPGRNTATVSVDFDQPIAAQDQTGILLGLNIRNLSEPADEKILPLRPRYWRTRPTQAYIERVQGLGSTAVALLSEGWYPGDDPARRPPPPWATPERFEAWKEHCRQVARAHGNNVLYDIWNEPDHPTFFTHWPDGNWDNFLRTFKAAHDAIREIVPDAVIVGPSTSADFPWLLLRSFMDFCLREGLRVEVLATHLFGDTDPSFEEMKEDLLRMRAEFIDNPKYAAVATERYMATEYANPQLVFRPGSMLAMLRFMEKGQVDGAMRSTWDNLDPGVNTAFNGSLGGLLTPDLKSTRAIWWALRWYAEGAGMRVYAESDNPEVVPLASFNKENPRESQVLLASRSWGGPAQNMRNVQVNLSGLNPAARAIPVWVYRAPNASGAAAFNQPELLDNPTLSVTRGRATVQVRGLQAHDAVLIRFSELP